MIRSILIVGLLLILSSFTFSSCQDKKNTMENASSGLTCLEITKATTQAHYPGMYSNLRNTRKYSLVLKSDCDQSIELKWVYVDDIQLPVTGFVVNGKVMNGEIPAGENASILVTTSRNYYNTEEENKMVEEETYINSGRQMNGKVVLIYSSKGKTYETEAITLEELDSINHP